MGSLFLSFEFAIFFRRNRREGSRVACHLLPVIRHLLIPQKTQRGAERDHVLPVTCYLSSVIF